MCSVQLEARLVVPNANPNGMESTLGWTALHAASVTDAVECARLLLKYGADPCLPSVRQSYYWLFR